MVRRLTLLMLVAIVILAMGAGVAGAVTLTSQQELGKALFFDSNLSDPAGQACADCHGPLAGWTGPDTPSTPPARLRRRDARAGRQPQAARIGIRRRQPDPPPGPGQQRLGRRELLGRPRHGLALGDPLAEQAQGPFLNPVEQNHPEPGGRHGDRAGPAVRGALRSQSLAPASASDVNTPYEAVGRAVAAYESSAEANAFSSKYDPFLECKPSSARRRGAEWPSSWARPTAGRATSQPGLPGPPLFTDFTYDNLGIPKNPANPFYANPSTRTAPTGWIPGSAAF